MDSEYNFTAPMGYGMSDKEERAIKKKERAMKKKEKRRRRGNKGLKEGLKKFWREHIW